MLVRVALVLDPRHRLEEGLVAVLAPLAERDPARVAVVVLEVPGRSTAESGCVAGVVVLDLVVVPDRDEGVAPRAASCRFLSVW